MKMALRANGRYWMMDNSRQPRIMVVFYLIVFLSVLPIYLLDALAISALDSNVWNSKATIYIADHHAEHMPWELPFSCQFENVFIDATSVYFIANDLAVAAIDLYSCCVLNDREWSNYRCPVSSSVHFSLCYCFNDRKYGPAIATEAQLELLKKNGTTTAVNLGKADNYLKGVTWAMNHWSYWKHPDHFTMKVLEFRSLMDNRGLTDECCYSSLPAKVDHLVSMDYPAYPLTDYESFIMEIIRKSAFSQDFDYFSLAKGPLEETSLHDRFAVLNKRQKLYSYCDSLDQVKNRTSKRPSTPHPKNNSNHSVNTTAFDFLTTECADQNINISIAQRLPFYYSEQLVLSPKYKNNIPEPSNVTMHTFHQAIGKVLSEKHNHRNHTKPVVVILHDVASKRRISNLDEVSRFIQSILHVSTVEMWYLDGKMPATEQARKFHSFDVLISPHSSLLTNVVFARNGSFVLEVLPESYFRRYWENSFMNLGKGVGVNYYLLKNGRLNEKHGSGSDMWDFTVKGTELAIQLSKIKDRWDLLHSQSVH
jgi:hypothetical protein